MGNKIGAVSKRTNECKCRANRSCSRQNKMIETFCRIRGLAGFEHSELYQNNRKRNLKTNERIGENPCSKWKIRQMRAINTCWKRLFSQSGCCNLFDYFHFLLVFVDTIFGKFQARLTPASMGAHWVSPLYRAPTLSSPPIGATVNSPRRHSEAASHRLFPLFRPFSSVLFWFSFHLCPSSFSRCPSPTAQPIQGAGNALHLYVSILSLPINPLLLGSQPVNFSSHTSRLQLRLPSATVDASSLVQGFLFTSSIHLQAHQQSCQGSFTLCQTEESFMSTLFARN